jgi:hypothetical protein
VHHSHFLSAAPLLLAACRLPPRPRRCVRAFFCKTHLHPVTSQRENMVHTYNTQQNTQKAGRVLRLRKANPKGWAAASPSAALAEIEAQVT